MITLELGNKLIISCRPGETLNISKQLHEDKFEIETVIFNNEKYPKYDFVIWEGIKVFDRNNLHKKSENTE